MLVREKKCHQDYYGDDDAVVAVVVVFCVATDNEEDETVLCSILEIIPFGTLCWYANF